MAGARAGKRVSRWWRRSLDGPRSRSPQLSTYPGSVREDGRRQRRTALPGPLTTAPTPAPAAGADYWLRRHGTASAWANQRLAAPFGNFFPRARAPRGHAAALGRPRPGRLPRLGRDLDRLRVCRRFSGRPGTGLDARATLVKKIRHRLHFPHIKGKTKIQVRLG